MAHDSPIQVRLKVQADGAQVLAAVQFTNTSERAQLLYEPNACLSGKVQSDVFDIACDGVRVPNVGPRVRRRAPQAEDFVVLQPGEQISVRLRLDGPYAFPPGGGSCTVRYVAVHGDAEQLGEGVFGARSSAVSVSVGPTPASESPTTRGGEP